MYWKPSKRGYLFTTVHCQLNGEEVIIRKGVVSIRYKKSGYLTTITPSSLCFGKVQVSPVLLYNKTVSLLGMSVNKWLKYHCILSSSDLKLGER